MYLAIYRNLFAISAVVHDTVLYVMNVAHMQDSRPANHPPKMFEVYSDGENCTPAQQLQQEQLGVALASYGSGGSALLQAHAELYATRQRCKDLEMSLLLKEEALEHRDECLMYSRKQLKGTTANLAPGPCRAPCTCRFCHSTYSTHISRYLCCSCPLGCTEYPEYRRS